MPTIALSDRKIASFATTGTQREYFDRSFPGFGVRVNQGGRKTFILMYRTTEKKLRRMALGMYGLEAPGITLAKARELARKELDKATIGRDPAAERKRAKQQTFSALVDLYIERHAKRHKRSWRDDARRLRRLTPAWGAWPVAAIRRSHVRELLEGIVDRGKNVEANRTLALVRKVLNFAVDQEWIDANPAGKMAQPGGRESSRARVLTADELRVTWAFLPNAAIDVHVSQRPNGEGDLAQVVDAYPGVLGIGVDAGTAVVVHGNQFEVIGGPDARVTITDGQRHDGKPYYFLKRGDRFDLARRVMIPAG